MELTNIVPNGPFGQPITNKQFINYLTKTINYNYNLRQHNVFPAPQPVSIEKKDFEKLSKYEYNVSLKLDGTRFLLLFLKDKNNKKHNILINRALKFYDIVIEAENKIYDGTLFDGELIFINNSWKFIVYDALQSCGNKINTQNYTNRLFEAKSAIESYIYNKDTSTIELELKTFYKFSSFEQFVTEQYLKSDISDGLIFMPEHLTAKGGTQYSMLKWKPPEKHTFDFLIIENNEGFIAQVFHLNKLENFAKIYKNTEQGSKFIEETKKLESYTDKCIVECSFDKENNNFKPILVRTDKNHPNSLRTIERTLFNINENITIDDFKKIEINKKETDNLIDDFEKVNVD